MTLCASQVNRTASNQLSQKSLIALPRWSGAAQAKRRFPIGAMSVKFSKIDARDPLK
jgi:hypothetical protein